MRNGGIILYCRYLDAGGRQGSNGALAAVAGAFQVDFDFPNARVVGGFSHDFRGDLRRERRAFSRSLEPGFSGRSPCDDVALKIRNIDERIVEGGFYVRNTFGRRFLLYLFYRRFLNLFTSGFFVRGFFLLFAH